MAGLVMAKIFSRKGAIQGLLVIIKVNILKDGTVNLVILSFVLGVSNTRYLWSKKENLMI